MFNDAVDFHLIKFVLTHLSGQNETLNCQTKFVQKAICNREANIY